MLCQLPAASTLAEMVGMRPLLSWRVRVYAAGIVISVKDTKSAVRQPLVLGALCSAQCLLMIVTPRLVHTAAVQGSAKQCKAGIGR